MTAKALTTTVMKRGPARFTIFGQKLPYELIDLPESISPGLAKRLHCHAQNRLEEAGFLGAVDGWAVEIYTMDGEKSPSDRNYGVKFRNPKGGYIAVVGIMTRHGWPSLDFGFDIGHEEPKDERR